MMRRIPVRHVRSLRRQQGLSLVELMVSMTLSLLLLTALATLYFNTSRARNAFANSGEQIENGRYSLDVMSREVELAGFFGLSNLESSAVVSAPDLCATDPASLGFSGSPATVPLAVQGFAPGTVAPCLPNLLPGSEILAVRRVSTTPVSAAAVGTPYLQTSRCADDTVPLVFDASAPAFKLRTKTCDSTVPAELRAAVVRIFYLAGCDQCNGTGDGKPTLKMAELFNGGFRVQAVAEGIEDMHLSYGIDLDGNGAPDCYIADPGTDNSAICTGVAAYDWSVALTNWHNVTAVRVQLLARTAKVTDGWTDQRTYDLGRAQASGPFRDGYKRHVYAQLARVANVAGPRESQ